MRNKMKVTKEVKSSVLRGIVVLPPDAGDIVTITVTDYQAPRKPDKESMRAAMGRIEAGIKPSNRTLDDFRSERLAMA